MATFQKTYWASNGRFQAMAEHLTAALPQFGAVEGSPSLERFRVLTNLYYDAHNNGGGNKAKELAKLCNVNLVPETALKNAHIDFDDMGKVYKKLEKEMDKIIPVAFVELFEKNQDKHAAMSSKGGKASKRKITPEQQAKLQAARKAARDKKKGQAA